MSDELDEELARERIRIHAHVPGQTPVTEEEITVMVRVWTEQHRTRLSHVAFALRVFRLGVSLGRTGSLRLPTTPKGLREALCVAQAAIHERAQRGVDTDRAAPWVLALGSLIRQLDVMRPLGPDGKHGNRHTPLCGCYPERN